MKNFKHYRKKLGDQFLQGMTKLPAWTLWAVGAPFLFLLSNASIKHKKNQVISAIEIDIKGVEQHNDLLKEDVYRHIEESFGIDFTGTKIDLLDLENIEQVIRQYDFVKSAEVYVDARKKIHVDIVQRQPIVRIFDKTGDHYYLDEVGVSIQADGDLTSRVLVVNGIIGPYEQDEEGNLLGGLNEVYLFALKLRSNPFMHHLVEQVYVKTNGEMVLYPKIGSERIQFGYIEDIDIKFKRLKNFYEGGIRYQGWNKYEEIDLRYKDQVITKQRA